ncbi:MAG: polysaccharide pyruvyl transferase family protein [Dehalococcoidales bacterium]|nr:MAG: polysaccharide pyruvyl transferase family protein [Dehalococcoidales bacterium]
MLQRLLAIKHLGLMIMKAPFRPVKRQFFYLRIKKYKNVKKIIHTITPWPSLRNVGDHAQVMAITAWLRASFKDRLILEFDASEVYKNLAAIKKIVNEDDLIILQSGGNLGSGYLFSEGARRLVIENFPNNKIVSLPQTISFGTAPKDQNELEISRRIYNNHRDLTVIARDERSFELSQEYFPNCKSLLCPDFVLYLATDLQKIERQKVLLCLRYDKNSALSTERKDNIRSQVRKTNKDFDEYNTLINRNIPRRNREREFDETLRLFQKHELVITDRLHGLIFSIVANTPCIVLRTIDHKLSASVKWFSNLSHVTYTEDLNELPDLISTMAGMEVSDKIDWKKLYFNDLWPNIMANGTGNYTQFEED